jgi:hypothetical protein
VYQKALDYLRVVDCQSPLVVFHLALDFLMVVDYPLVACHLVAENLYPLVVYLKVVDYRFLFLEVAFLMAVENLYPLVEYHLVVDYQSSLVEYQRVVDFLMVVVNWMASVILMVVD